MWIKIVFGIYIYKVSNRINSKLFKIKMNQLVFHTPYIFVYFNVHLRQLKRIYKLKLRSFCKQKVTTMNSPIVFCNIYNARKHRLIAMFRNNTDCIYFISIFKKTTHEFITVIIQRIISNGRNKAPWVYPGSKHGNIIVIQADECGEIKTKSIAAALPAGDYFQFHFIRLLHGKFCN